MHDAIILAGGRGSRMGGVDKAAVELRGEPLVARALDAASAAQTIVVVGSTHAPLPPGVVLTQENPPGGGPAAGLVAGLSALNAPAPWTLLLSCDVPGAATAVKTLFAAAERAPTRDGYVLTDPQGRRQWTLGLYRTNALHTSISALASTSNCSLRAILGNLSLIDVPAQGNEWRDVDTWQDHETWQHLLLDP